MIDLLGCCCVYIVFVADNVKQVVDFHADSNWDARIYMALLLPFLLALCLVRNLKYLAPFSMVANILVAAGLGITYYYIFENVEDLNLESRPKFATFSQLPLFFGTAIFALEGIGVVSIIEYPQIHF